MDDARTLLQEFVTAMTGIWMDDPECSRVFAPLVARARELLAAPPLFAWNADEALKLLDRDCRIVLFKDGVGSVTALAIPRGTPLKTGVREWREFEPPAPVGREWAIEDAQREVFAGPNKFSGCGRSVAQALHCLTEKAVFNRLPDGKGGFYPPPPPDAA